MATIKIYHSTVKANPLLLDKIQQYFDTMFVWDEQNDFTLYQVEKDDKIGNIEIVLDFMVDDSGITVIGHRPAK